MKGGAYIPLKSDFLMIFFQHTTLGSGFTRILRLCKT